MIHKIKNIVTYSDHHTCRKTRMLFIAEMAALLVGMAMLSIVTVYLYIVK